MTAPAPGLAPLSYFWAPLCAVGSHGERGPNAQICLSISGSSIVRDRPRVTVSLWKDNYTHDLVMAAGTLAVTLLHESQLPLIEPLGLRSGRDRDGDKLAGLRYELTDDGDPWFPDGVGMLHAEVIEAFDLGDATSFLCAVRAQERLRDGPPLTWQQAQGMLPPEFMARWNAKSARDAGTARATMRWRT